MATEQPQQQIPAHLQAALAIPDPASISEVFGVLGQNHGELIEDYEAIDKQGCWITPRRPTDAASLELSITPTLAECNWIVTSLKAGRVLIEPRHTRFIQVEPPGPLFHVTTREHRASIKAKGLELRTGGNTRMQRKYPPRIFFALNLFAAFEFAEFQSRRDVMAALAQGEFDLIDPKLLLEIDIWRVHLPDGGRLRYDVLFPGKAGWIEQAIPKNNLSRVRSWRWVRRVWRLLRRRGLV